MDKAFSQPRLARAHFPIDWNAPDRPGFVPMGDADLERSIAGLFAQTTKHRGEAIALDDGTTRLSYAEALVRVRGLARRITQETEPGAPVASLLAEGCDFAIALLACLASGRLFIPLDPAYPAAWIAGVLCDARPAAVIGKADVPGGFKRIDPAAVPAAADYPLTPAGPDAPALVIFTSGSTGKPKGIVNSQRALLRRVQQQVNGAHVTAEDGFMPLSSGCTIAGIRERLTALLSGAPLYPADVPRLGAGSLLARLEESGASAIYAVPALLRTLMGLSERAPPRLRVVRVGGDAVLWSDVERLRAWLPPGCAVQLGYSSSEAPILQWIVGEDFPSDGLKVPLGYPLSDGELAICGEDGMPMAAGEAGELIVTSPYVALGHWRAGKLDPAPFAVAAHDARCRVLATGDLVRQRSDGLIEIIGRKDRQVKINGIRIEPGEVEAAVRLEPGVADAAILPRRLGKQIQLIAYVVAKPQMPDLDVALKAGLQSRLPKPMRPAAIEIVDAIPRLPSGKLDMKGLERLDAERQLDGARAKAADAASAPPQGDTEGAIAEIWQCLLQVPRIGRHADFFDLGGDSLLTLDLMFALERRFGRALPLTAIFEAPTIASLAALVESGAEASRAPLVKLKPGEGAPLVIVHGIGGAVMELLPAARQIAHEGPVFALQAEGLDGEVTPHDSIEGLAARYLSALAPVSGEGLHLAGYSAGGLIAYEMAKQLEAAGAPARSLILIDTQTHARFWSVPVWAAFLKGRWQVHAARLRHVPLSQRLALIPRLASHLMKRLARGVAPPPALPPITGAPPAVQAVYAANMRAIRAYRPQGYRGAVTLIAAQTRHPDIADPANIWPKLAAQLHVVSVPGDHFSMLRGENAATLAAALAAASAR